MQVAFAGARQLLDPAAHPDVDPAQFEAALQPLLTARLRRLPAELGLHPDRHPVCGLASLAIGGDTLFSRACAELGWPQRVFLPQPRDEFLAATSRKTKQPDFTPEQPAAARALLDQPHVIQERVVAVSRDRTERFQEVNLELVRAADMLVGLLRADQAGEPGGTAEALEHARSRGRPALELRVHVTPGGRPELEETWHHRDRFSPPTLPKELEGLKTGLAGLPSVEAFCGKLMAFGSATSKARQHFFKLGAALVVTAHVLATLAAVAALKLHGAAALPWILGGELLLLALGFGAHRWLHAAHAVRVWAMSRLLAELARSTAALREVPAYLAHLFTLPLPDALRPLLRTLNVLHLRATHRLPPASGQKTGEAQDDLLLKRRDTYVRGRLTDPQRGQIPYYEGQLHRAKRRYELAHRVFLGGSAGAIAATLLKLLLVCHCLPVPAAWHAGGAAWLGAGAILLPVVAVAALSLAAAYDLEARAHTFKEMLDFLRAQAGHLRAAPSEAAFRQLALETEARLLGETAAWYARRAFTGIA